MPGACCSVAGPEKIIACPADGIWRYPSRMVNCQLCRSASELVVWDDELCRVVRVGGPEGHAFPGYCRVIWRQHVAEMADLAVADRRHLMNVVVAVETALRSLLQPDKINLASLGNAVPHLHWHVIPRWRDDSHFPGSIWASALRPSPDRAAPDDASLRAAIVASLAEEECGA
jgi:diadenosine tetraphosphate (Ap4A) HIT family hydrolase